MKIRILFHILILIAFQNHAMNSPHNNTQQSERGRCQTCHQKWEWLKKHRLGRWIMDIQDQDDKIKTIFSQSQNIPDLFINLAPYSQDFKNLKYKNEKLEADNQRLRNERNKFFHENKFLLKSIEQQTQTTSNLNNNIIPIPSSSSTHEQETQADSSSNQKNFNYYARKLAQAKQDGQAMVSHELAEILKQADSIPTLADALLRHSPQYTNYQNQQAATIQSLQRTINTARTIYQGNLRKTITEKNDLQQQLRQQEQSYKDQMMKTYLKAYIPLAATGIALTAGWYKGYIRFDSNPHAITRISS